MGKSARDFFRSYGVKIIKKFHYCESTPELTTAYEPRNFVDELTFLRNTDTLYRYTLGNIQTGFNQSEILEAVSGNKDCLLTLSTDRIEIIRNLKEAYGEKVVAIFSYTDDAVLEKYFNSLGVSQAEVELRCSIGKTIKQCYQQNSELFDYYIMYGGENSLFDDKNIANQCRTLYIKSKIHKDDNQSELLNRILQIIKETQSDVKEIKSLLYFMKNDLQELLKKEKKNYESIYGAANDEKGITILAGKITNYINDQVIKRDDDGLLVTAESNLSEWFKDNNTWNRLLPNTKTTLRSVYVLWEKCPQQGEEFDYSGICMTATSALESELKRWFFTGFQDYLFKKYGHPSELQDVFEIWPEELLDTKYHTYQNAVIKPTVNCNEVFTLGKLPFLFYNEKNKVVRDRMTEYLDTIIDDKFKKEAGGSIGTIDWVNYSQKKRKPDSFISKCENIRNAYRNPAAHSGIISRNDAEDCYQSVIGKVDAGRHCLEVNGLIMELYSYLKI